MFCYTGQEKKNIKCAENDSTLYIQMYTLTHVQDRRLWIINEMTQNKAKEN